MKLCPCCIPLAPGDVFQLTLPLRGAGLLPGAGTSAARGGGWDHAHVHTQGKNPMPRFSSRLITPAWFGGGRFSCRRGCSHFPVPHSTPSLCPCALVQASVLSSHLRLGNSCLQRAPLPGAQPFTHTLFHRTPLFLYDPHLKK